MRLQRLPNGSVHFTELHEWHLDLLRSIPVLADASASEKARRRVFPEPFASGDATAEQKDDWNEFVRPEIEALFAGSLARVAADVKTARRVDQPEESPDSPAPTSEKPLCVRPPQKANIRPPRPPRLRAPVLAPPPPPEWTLTIPTSHTEDWFRAMNQARLVLSATHEAHRTDNAHIAQLFITGHMEVLVHYELLTGMCGWWVDAILSNRQ